MRRATYQGRSSSVLQRGLYLQAGMLFAVPMEVLPLGLAGVSVREVQLRSTGQTINDAVSANSPRLPSVYE